MFKETKRQHDDSNARKHVNSPEESFRFSLGNPLFLWVHAIRLYDKGRSTKYLSLHSLRSLKTTFCQMYSREPILAELQLQHDPVLTP